MLFLVVFIFSFGLGYAAPPGPRAEGKINSDEMVIRLVLHVQKTENGAQLVVNLEESPQNEPHYTSKPLLSVRTDFPTKRPKNDTHTPEVKNTTTFFQIKSAERPPARPFDFKISVSSATTAKPTQKPVTQISSTETTPTTTETSTDELLDEYPRKTVADQGFGVLASRCATYAPGLVSDGAGGCTKPANRLKKKNFPGTFTFRSASGNELHSDVKAPSTEPQIVSL